MRMHLPGKTAASRVRPGHAAWLFRWLDASALVLIAFVLVECLWRPSSKPPMLAPLLAVPPALGGIGATTVRRPLVYGVISLVGAAVVAAKPTIHAAWLPDATMITVVIITAVAAAGTAVSVRQERRLAEVTSVAEAAQRALLRPLPPRLGPLGLDVVYIAAAAEATVGGDLYEAVATRDHGIRLIMGDVRGKGLSAVELAADVLGMFRQLAHDAGTLAELATSLDTGLRRDLGRHEEFVTAVLVEIDQESGQTTVFNCGHPAPLLIEAPAVNEAPVTPATEAAVTEIRRRTAASCHVIQVEVPQAAPPLGLLSLGDCSGAHRSIILGKEDQLLLYTDGVTEARDARREFYPLSERVSALAAKAPAPGRALLASVPGGGAGRQGSLLDLVHADLLKHTGAPLNDDAALLLVRAPVTWPAALTVDASAQVPA